MGCVLIALFLFSKNRLQVRAHLQSRFKSVPLLMGCVILANPEPLRLSPQLESERNDNNTHFVRF